MFLKTHSPQDRLRVWREVRSREYSTPESIVEQFKPIVLQPRHIDYYTPSSWPSPFEIVTEGYLCQSGVTLVLAATLIYKKFILDDQICFTVISNNITGEAGIVLIHNNKVYNFMPGEIVELEFVRENATIFETHKIDIEKFSY